MNLIKFALILPLILAITSCSTNSLRTRDPAYLEAKSIPPLRIPPGLSSSQFETTYPVSDRNFSDSEKKVSLVPPGL